MRKKIIFNILGFINILCLFIGGLVVDSNFKLSLILFIIFAILTIFLSREDIFGDIDH